MSKRSLYLTVAVVGVSAGSLTLVAAARPAPDIPVTITIADFGATTPLAVESDRQGAYVTKTVQKTTQVKAVLISNPTGEDWNLTTYYSSRNAVVSSDRRVFFDLREQVAPGGFPTPFLGTDANGLPVEYGQVTVHLIGKCSMVNVAMTRMAAGASALCPGSFRFRSPDGLWYRFSFQPDNFSQVDRMKVTCERADTTGCREWTVVPGNTILTGSDPNPKGLQTLLQLDEGGAILAQGGDYLLSFSIRINR